MDKARLHFCAAKPEEMDAVLALYRSVLPTEGCTWNQFYPGMEEIREDQSRGLLCLLKAEGRLLGALSIVGEKELDALDCWSPAACPMELARIAVSPALQGQGLAEEMLLRAETLLRVRGCDVIRLLAAEGNPSARRLYEKNGFQSKGQYPMYDNLYIAYEKSLETNPIQQRLFPLGEDAYADFQRKLTPGVHPSLFIGVRLPALRALGKTLKGTPEAETFLSDLPHKYYEENMLHAILVSNIRDYRRCLEETERFLPHVDNWAVCDSFRPRVFGRHLDALLPEIRRWCVSPEPFICRFGIEMLMNYYLDKAFRPEYLEIPAAVTGEDYYVRMMVAWFFATALAKQWDAALPYIRDRRLPEWTHRKTIQKARESFRITAEQNALLKTLL